MSRQRVVRRSKDSTAPPRRRVSSPGDDVARLRRSFYHWEHHAERADVQRPRHELVLEGRHTHQWNDVQSAAIGNLLLDRVDAGARVFHIEEHEFRSGLACDLRKPGGEELEREETETVLASQQLVFKWIAPHRRG
jgi:hypothetical protein